MAINLMTLALLSILLLAGCSQGAPASAAISGHPLGAVGPFDEEVEVDVGEDFDDGLRNHHQRQQEAERLLREILLRQRHQQQQLQHHHGHSGGSFQHEPESKRHSGTMSMKQIQSLYNMMRVG